MVGALQQRHASVVLLDLSGVKTLEGGGLGMLLFLQMWTRAQGHCIAQPESSITSYNPAFTMKDSDQRSSPRSS